MALDTDIESIIGDEGFKHVCQAIRNATVSAHFARNDPSRRSKALTPQYDLVTTLAEAAHRHPADFVRELCYFVAHYNDQLARPSAPRFRTVRQEDLERVTRWVLSDRRGVVPAAILAFGTSVNQRRDVVEGDQTTDSEPADGEEMNDSEDEAN